MSIKKQYLRSRPICKVTFRMPKTVAEGAHAVHLVGEFNNWSTIGTPMKSLKSGEFKTTLELTPGKEYQFRYLINQEKWENEWEADKYVRNDFGNCDNSVIVV
ncbi:MAG: glycoside hydrolase [Desulfobacteraceae bacterium]|nr:glycoside hydrolase [Desulfobacteraceae bacterium]